MAKVALRAVSKMYPGDIVAVDNVNLEVKDKEFVVFVGPSGCGKSTTLRMVAGLEEITNGQILIDDTVVNDVPAKNRDIAMVFQNYALYPHMTVYNNLAFGLKLRRYPSREIDRRVREAAEILDIATLLQRKPKALSGGQRQRVAVGRAIVRKPKVFSGGQRQRVAVGRAIVRKPKVFLFDEPLSNLDAKLRVQMRTEIKKLHNRLQTTMIYVTHDQVEALTMGTRIVVMKDGVIQQVADPISLYDKPCNKFVASFIGSPPMNFMEGKVLKLNNAYYFQDTRFRLKIFDRIYDRIAKYENKKVIFGIRPENIYDRLFAQAASDEFTVTATVEVVEPMGAEIYLHLSTGTNTFVARVSAHDTAKANQDLQVVFDMTKAHFFDLETESTIA
ncbi:MAG: glycerol-3-phosphate ABC transporter ATP-binding protein [Omnitrophica bacterium GWA2_50_21]|nr:MAG: glycerol-3-phosphate ABC transporter ATP-binding protein [Omnitrophica bacterium GWA2_50_21]